MDKQGKNNISIRLEQDFFDRLHSEAKKRGQTLAGYIKQVLFEELAKSEAK